MSRDSALARLETLLARVVDRRREPRVRAVTAEAASQGQDEMLTLRPPHLVVVPSVRPIEPSRPPVAAVSVPSDESELRTLPPVPSVSEVRPEARPVPSEPPVSSEVEGSLAPESEGATVPPPGELPELLDLMASPTVTDVDSAKVSPSGSEASPPRDALAPVEAELEEDARATIPPAAITTVPSEPERVTTSQVTQPERFEPEALVEVAELVRVVPLEPLPARPSFAVLVRGSLRLRARRG